MHPFLLLMEASCRVIPGENDFVRRRTTAPLRLAQNGCIGKGGSERGGAIAEQGDAGSPGLPGSGLGVSVVTDQMPTPERV